MISEGIDYKVRIYVIKIQWVYKFHIKKSRNYKIKVHLKYIYIVPFSFIYRLLIKYHFHINLVKEDKFRKRAACDEYSNERIH